MHAHMLPYLRRTLQLLQRSCSVLKADELTSALRGFAESVQPKSLPQRSKDILQATIVQYPFPVQYLEKKESPVLNLNKEVISKCSLPGDVFNVPVRIDILHRVVRWQRAKRQQGTHKTKNRSEVSGGGRKPWKQKGTGRARAGSIRAPQWRHGGLALGPVPRSHAHELPKKVRRLGLKCALSAKSNEGRLIIVDSLRPELPKTKILFTNLQGLLGKPERLSALLVDDDKHSEAGILLRRAAANIPGVEVLPQIGLNVFSLLTKDYVIITQTAAEQLVNRLRSPINRLGASRENRLALVDAAKQHTFSKTTGGGTNTVNTRKIENVA